MAEAPQVTADQPPRHYVPVALGSRHDGWTAERQRRFIMVLAETGSVTAAARETGIAPRSAYRLRARPDGQSFAQAWDDALLSATANLLTLAFEGATAGTPREIWRDGKLILQTRQPSEKLMMFLLTHLMPRRFGPVDPDLRGLRNPSGQARRGLTTSLARLTDNELGCECAAPAHLDAVPPNVHPD